MKTNNFDGKVCTEKHICDLGKNNYFGERALLNSEPRAGNEMTNFDYPDHLVVVSIRSGQAKYRINTHQ